MKNKSFQMAILYDFYGDLLTERQKEFFDLYYNEDFSLAEISENKGITRQGVRDIIVRAEAILTNIEEKTGIAARFLKMQSEIASIEKAAEEIIQINGRNYLDERLEDLAERILKEAGSLKG